MHLCTTACNISTSIQCVLVLLCHCFVYTPGVLPETKLGVIHFATYTIDFLFMVFKLLTVTWHPLWHSKSFAILNIKYLIAVCSYCHFTSVNAIAEKYIFEYNQRLYSQGWLAGNDRGFKHSFVQAGVTPPVNSIEHICRCPGDTVEVPQFVP